MIEGIKENRSLLSFDGHIGRLNYFLYSFSLGLFNLIIAKLIDGFEGENQSHLIMGIGLVLLGLATVPIGLSLLTRRIRDINYKDDSVTGTVILAFISSFIPILNLVVAYFLLFKKGAVVLSAENANKDIQEIEK